jgi:uncharacterized membrane protein YccC
MKRALEDMIGTLAIALAFFPARRLLRRAVDVAIGFAIAIALAAAVAHADPQPALDRQLVERLVRAVESQAEATRDIARAATRR